MQMVEKCAKWRKENPEKAKQSNENYYANNREKMVLCECGLTYNIMKKTRHYETLKHKKNLNL